MPTVITRTLKMPGAKPIRIVVSDKHDPIAVLAQCFKSDGMTISPEGIRAFETRGERYEQCLRFYQGFSSEPSQGKGYPSEVRVNPGVAESSTAAPAPATRSGLERSEMMTSAPPPDEVPSGEDTSADTAATPAAEAEEPDRRGEASGRVEAAGAKSAARESAGSGERRAAGNVPTYRVVSLAGQLSAEQRKVVGVFLAQPWISFTHQEIVRDCGFAIDVVRDRVKELLEEPLAVLVELPEKRRCHVSEEDVAAFVLARST